jgi:hypothetical protein
MKPTEVTEITETAQPAEHRLQAVLVTSARTGSRMPTGISRGHPAFRCPAT